MEEAKLSTRVLLVSAITLLVILLTGPFGYKFGLVPLQPSILSLAIAVVGGILVAVIALVYLVIAIRNDLSANRNLLLVAIVVSLIPMVLIGPQMAKARSVPPIHDITTDTENPPEFVAIKPLRANAPNGVDYGGAPEWPADKLAAETRKAYPDLVSIESDLGVAAAAQRAAEVLTAMGLEIVAVDAAAGVVEATATTFWFGFKDDVVVRIVEQENGSLLDLRSMSRVGQSDIGVNAARIADFAQRY